MSTWSDLPKLYSISTFWPEILILEKYSRKACWVCHNLKTQFQSNRVWIKLFPTVRTSFRTATLHTYRKVWFATYCFPYTPFWIRVHIRDCTTYQDAFTTNWKGHYGYHVIILRVTRTSLFVLWRVVQVSTINIKRRNLVSAMICGPKEIRFHLKTTGFMTSFQAPTGIQHHWVNIIDWASANLAAYWLY